MRPTWHWLALGVLMLGEFLLFDQLVSRHHAWVYPRWNDQIQYLTEAYTSYEQYRQHGLWAGLREAVLNPAAQGTVHDIVAVLVFALAGPSRSAALAINALAFLLWQAATFAAWWRLTGRWSLAWLSAGLLLCVEILIGTGPGSPVDFRLDWLACCALGTVAAAGLCTGGLRRTGWSALWGLAIGLAILTRFLTLVYFGAMFLALLLWLGGLWLRQRDRPAAARFARLLLAAAIAATVALPILWHNREWVINYYWIGHLTGPESALRSPNFGLIRSLEAVFREWLWQHHLGTFFVRTTGLLLAGLGLIALITRFRRSADAPPPPFPAVGWAVGLGALLLLIPGVILTLHSQKSPFVVSVLVPGCLTLVLAAVSALLLRCPRWAGPVTAAAVLAAGGWHFVRGLRADPHTAAFHTDARKVNALADFLYATTGTNGLTTPYVGIDQVSDAIDGLILRVVCYERHGRWVLFCSTIPTGIQEDREELIRERVAQSDFLFLTDDLTVEGYWPSDKQLRRLYPELKAWCEAHLQPAESFTLFGRAMTLYLRKELQPALPPHRH